MFERFTRNRGFGRDRNGDGVPDGQADGTRTAVADRPSADERTAVADRPATDQRTAVADRPATTTRTAPRTRATAPAAATTEAAWARRRERFGGPDGTAIFFGWLSALGLAAIVVAVVSAAGTQLDLSSNNPNTIGFVGAAIVAVTLFIAYFCGGYVSGRMARFDGTRQGLSVWVLGVLVTIGLAVAGWVGGSEYNVYQQLSLPRIPVDEGDVATIGIVTLAVVLVGTLLASIAGGKAGERYHRRIDDVV